MGDQKTSLVATEAKRKSQIIHLACVLFRHELDKAGVAMRFLNRSPPALNQVAATMKKYESHAPKFPGEWEKIKAGPAQVVQNILKHPGRAEGNTLLVYWPPTVEFDERSEDGTVLMADAVCLDYEWRDLPFHKWPYISIITDDAINVLYPCKTKDFICNRKAFEASLTEPEQTEWNTATTAAFLTPSSQWHTSILRKLWMQSNVYCTSWTDAQRQAWNKEPVLTMFFIVANQFVRKN